MTKKGTQRGCSLRACDRPHLAKSFCKLHYARWKRTGTTDDPSPRVYPERFCEVEGCDRPHHCRGMCNAHYRRQLGTRPITETCSREGCEERRHALGACRRHYVWERRKARHATLGEEVGSWPYDPRRTSADDLWNEYLSWHTKPHILRVRRSPV